MKTFIGFTLIGMVLILFGAAISRIVPNYEQRENMLKEQCYSYERQGALKPGSCDCAERIYKTWEESYDWMDACMILQSRTQ